MLEIQNLTAGYPGTPVLQDLQVTIPEGKVTAILGPNGSGKSTLLKALAGILPSQGTIRYAGESICPLSPKLRAQKIAYLPQSRQVPEISVLRLVLHGRFPYLSYPRRYRKTDRQIAWDALEQLGIQDLAERNLTTLSGGQRQKVYIAMALAQDTPIVLLDEPTTYLDIRHQLQMMRLAHFLARKGKTVVLVLHDLTLALEHADHLILLNQGALAAQGGAAEVLASRTIPLVFGVEVRNITTPDGEKYYMTMP